MAPPVYLRPGSAVSDPSLTRIEKRDRRRAKRRDALLDHAMAIVEESGVAGLTIAGLAKHAGAAVGALYRYFDSKQSVIAGLQVRAVRRLAAFQQERLATASARLDGADETVAALARVWVVFTTWMAFAEAEPVLFRLVDSSLSDPDPVLSDALATEVEAATRSVLAPCAELIEHAVGARALDEGDSLLRTTTLWAGLHGISHFRKRDRLVPDSLHAARLEQSLLRGCLVGWGASPQTLEEAVGTLA